MNILLVSCAYPPYKEDSGVAKLLANLSTELLKKHQVHIFSLMDDTSLKKYEIKNTCINKVKVRFINVPRSSLTDFYGRYMITDYYNPDINSYFKSYISEIKPDIIHFHAIQGLGVGLISEAHKEGYPTILTMHDMWWFCPNLFMVDLNLCQCNQKKINIQQCTNCLKDIYKLQYEKNLNIESFLSDREKYLKHVLETDVDIVLTVSNALKGLVSNNINREININENGIVRPHGMIEKKINPKKIIFGFVGGTSLLKGYNILIDVFNNIKLYNWELHIYDVNETDRQKFLQKPKNKDFLRHFLRSLNVKQESSDKIKYFPRYTDAEKYKILNSLDIIIVPSVVRESFSLITREGLILKKPIICSDCGGPEEIIKHGLNGLIFKTGDIEDLKSNIYIILKNPSLINGMKNNINIHNIKSIEEHANELEHIYKLKYSKCGTRTL